MYVYVYVCIYTHICVYIFIYKYLATHTPHTHTHTHIYVYTQTHTHVFGNSDVVNKIVPKKSKCKKAKWLSEEVLQIVEKRREVKVKEKGKDILK